MNTETKTHSTERPMTPEEVGLLVRLYRQAMEWTQETLAELSGLTVRTVQRVEAGQPSSHDTRRALARGFRIPNLDAFSQPMPFPTEEKLQEQKAAFDRDYVVLDAERVDGRRLVSMLVDGGDYAAISGGSTIDLVRAAQDAFAGILDFARDCMDVADVASRTEMLGYGDTLDELIGELGTAGFCLCAAQRRVSITGKDWADPTPLPLALTYLVAAPTEAPPARMAVPRAIGQASF